MNLTWRQTLAMLVAVGAILGASGRVCPAAPSLFSSPLVVHMSGTLQPFTEHESHGLDTLTVTIEDKQKWLFKVSHVDTMPDTDIGVRLLSEIFPPQLRLLGSPSTMALLEQPTVAGKAVTLQGFLYIADRNFYVGDVNVAAETAQ